MPSKWIEIQGTDFVNKGAEMMLLSTIQAVAQWSPSPKLVVSPAMGSYEERAKLGLHQKVWIGRLPKASRLLGRGLPNSLKSRYGLVDDAQINTVLDASGFAYSDQWGYRNTEKMGEKAELWRSQGKKVVMLPQAFGPFQDERSHKAVEKLVANADLIFARDDVSYQHLTQISLGATNIYQCPDFTSLLEPDIPPQFDQMRGQYVIITPSQRMLDKGDARAQSQYLDFLRTCLDVLHAKGLQLWLVPHETDDIQLVKRVQAMMNFPIEMIDERDPRKLKGIIAASKCTITSRYHGLISALNHNVPSLVAGWSHKYAEVLKEYGLEELMVDLRVENDVRQLIEQLTDEPFLAEAAAKMQTVNIERRAKVEAMWKQVQRLVN